MWLAVTLNNNRRMRGLRVEAKEWKITRAIFTTCWSWSAIVEVVYSSKKCFKWLKERSGIFFWFLTNLVCFGVKSGEGNGKRHSPSPPKCVLHLLFHVTGAAAWDHQDTNPFWVLDFSTFILQPDAARRKWQRKREGEGGCRLRINLQIYGWKCKLSLIKNSWESSGSLVHLAKNFKITTFKGL